MTWTRENLVTFIDIYRSHPCLWKTKCDQYKNRNLKNQAYGELVKFCQNSVCPEANKEFVLKKIQAIRASFRKELKKVDDSKKKGLGVGSIHTPNLWYFDSLLFTKNQEDPTEGLGNQCKTVPDISSEYDVYFETKEEQVSFEAATSKGVTSTRNILKRELEENNKLMQVCQRTLEKSINGTTEFEAIGINVAKKLEKMEFSQAVYAENLISCILKKGLLNQLTTDTVVCD